MDYRFDTEQLKSDAQAIKDTFLNFLISFGPSAKKIQGRKIGFFEEIHTLFRLSLVEMGISKIIRTGVFIILGVIVYITFFRPVSSDMKWVIGFFTLIYYIWLFMPHLEKNKKDGSFFADMLITFYQELFSVILPAPTKKK